MMQRVKDQSVFTVYAVNIKFCYTVADGANNFLTN